MVTPPVSDTYDQIIINQYVRLVLHCKSVLFFHFISVTVVSYSITEVFLLHTLQSIGTPVCRHTGS